MPRLHLLRIYCAGDGSGGNALGVFLDGGTVLEERRQAVAADLGLSETVFVDDAASGVEALDGAPPGRDLVAPWAWLDEDAGVVRLRAFGPRIGIDEDEATGSAATKLCTQLGRPIDIRQGRGSRILASPVADGRAEIGGASARPAGRGGGGGWGEGHIAPG